jgi:hypothetical protein
MDIPFIVKLRTGSITGPVVANTQVITANVLGTGLTVTDIISNGLTGTVTTDGTGAGFFTKQIIGPTYGTFVSDVAPEEGNVLVFTISTTNVPQGTTLYWSMPELGYTDFTVGNIGSYRDVTDGNLTFTEHPVTKINGTQYGVIINRLYLRYLGRYPDNSNVVNAITANLLNESTTIEAVEATLYTEYQNSPPYPSGNISVAANGNAILTGTVIRDSRPEFGSEPANLIVRINATNGLEVARQNFTVIDTDPGLLIAYGTPVSINEGETRQFSLVSLGGHFINSNVSVRVTSPVDGGTSALPGVDIQLDGGSSVNVFISTSNVIIRTINLTAVSDGVAPEQDEWFLLRAFTESNVLITSSANILIPSN